MSFVTEMEKIKLWDGKYEIVWRKKGGEVEFYARRYGEKWRDLTGDNLIYAMFCRIQELEAELKKTTQTN